MDNNLVTQAITQINQAVALPQQAIAPPPSAVTSGPGTVVAILPATAPQQSLGMAVATSRAVFQLDAGGFSAFNFENADLVEFPVKVSRHGTLSVRPGAGYGSDALQSATVN